MYMFTCPMGFARACEGRSEGPWVHVGFKAALFLCSCKDATNQISMN